MFNLCLIGTPARIADEMQARFESQAYDGINITPTHLPAGCEDFVGMVIPKLQWRIMFLHKY
ncbi:hypothetical protein [Rhodopila sp.]|uniref:hypothetical protein n=1 Tax=Rhodopila sp. TaxID=2480087 RepID=UPI003D09B9E6